MALFLRVFLAVIVLSSAACGGGNESKEAAPAPAAVAANPVDPATAGGLKGSIKLEGSPPATQTINRVLSFYPPHQQAEVRFSLASALQAVVSLRLVPRADKPGRVPACEVLINTQTVRDQIRDMDKTLNIPDLIKEGTVQYGMQSFDQSLMHYYSQGIISYESAVFFATSPSEFALRVQGVAGTSDTSWSGFEGDSQP